ncbi:hypothetical protein LCGC14_1895610, partial [marine sediment metagenome]
DSAAWDRAPGNAADGLLVNLGTNNDVDTELPAAAALGDGDANPTTPIVGAALMGWNTATWDRLVSSIAQGLEVDVTRVIPGTGATNLGKAIDSVAGAADVGVALLGIHDSSATHLTTAEGDYDTVRLSDYGAFQVAPEQHFTLDSLNATAGWAALNNDTVNLATTLKHVLGTNALTFDKVDGAANTIFAAIEKTISSVDLGGISPHDIIQTSCYIPDLADVTYLFVRLGTDASNYNEWRVPDTALTAATFEILVFNIGDAHFAGITGNGWNPSAVTYIAVGVAFDAETNALAGIVFDELSFHTNQHTSAELNAEVSSSVSSANVNLQKVGGSVTDKGAGNVSNGSQRVVLASDDVLTAAIRDAVELLDNAVYVDDADWVDDTSSHLLVGGLYQSALQTITDGDVGPFQVDVNGRLIVSPSTALDVSGAVVTVDLAGNNDVVAEGDVAHDAPDSGGGGPVKIGGRAQEPEAQPEEVADDDRVDALFDRNGYMRVRGDFNPQFADINDAGSGDNAIIAAQAAGKRIAVWSILLVSDGTVDIRFEDGAAGTPFTGQIPLQVREGFSTSAGGLVPLFVGSAATLLNLELSAAIAVHGFVSFTTIDD